MADALKAAPSYEGVAYRGMNVTEDQARDYAPGNHVTFGSVSSWSRDEGHAASHAHGNATEDSVGLMLTLPEAGKHLVSLEGVGGHPHELVNRPGARFKILATQDETIRFDHDGEPASRKFRILHLKEL
jgi:hypothetical protein